MDDREEAPHPLIPIPAGPRRSLAERVRGADSYGLLLILILLSLLTTAVVGEGNWGRVVITAVTGATTLFAFWTSRPGVAVLRVVAVVVAVGLVAAIASAVAGSGTELDHVGRIGLALITAATPITVGRRLLRHQRIQGSTILGALCIYLLLGQFFAYLFSAIGAFNKPFFVQETSATLVDYLYFSYTTQTTVGYGDFTAAQNLGRMLAISEALAGQLYLVTVIALLVSNIGRSRAR